MTLYKQVAYELKKIYIEEVLNKILEKPCRHTQMRR